ncbi:MAG: DNA recombination protein RmuC, partial [Phycisphaerales bacterium]|nr:DNA recombination protein RmuC [Phycisphaerales bacterium]
SPEFVVMFVPGDQFIDAALQHRPELFEQVAQRGVILASPSTLIGLLRAVHVGWREKRLSQHAHELFKLGRELHDRAATMLGYANRVGSSLESAVKSYNQFVGSVDSRLMPTLRRFEEEGAKSGKEIAEIKPIETTPRDIGALPEAARTPSLLPHE